MISTILSIQAISSRRAAFTCSTEYYLADYGEYCIWCSSKSNRYGSVKQASELAQIASYIESTGYDTFVGEGAFVLVVVSVVVIARALYKQSKVLVFDEATSALVLQLKGSYVGIG